MKKSAPQGRDKRSPKEADRRVGENLRQLRHRRNITLHHLAADLGISHQQLYKYERGLNRISAGTLEAVSEALAIPVDFLFREHTPCAPAEAASALWIEALRSEAVYRIGRIRSEHSLEEIVRALKALAPDP